MNDTIEQQELEGGSSLDIMLLLREIMHGIRKFWWVVIVTTVVMAAMMYFRSMWNYYPIYQCKATFTVATGSSADSSYSYSFYYDKSTASQMASTFPYILESDLLMGLIKQDMNVDYVNGSISASAVSNSNLFTLTVTSSSPEDSLEILESVIRNYPTAARYVIGDTVLNMIAAPELPTTPINSPNLTDSAVKGAFFGLVFGVMFIFLYAITKRTIRTEEEFREVLNITCLGIVPVVEFKKRRKKIEQKLSILNENTGDFFQESIRGIALRLAKQMQEKNEKTLMVTCTYPEEGTTTVARNLAIALAEMDKKVILLYAGSKKQQKLKVKKRREKVKEHSDVERMFRGECVLKDILTKEEDTGIWYLDCSGGLNRIEQVTAPGNIKILMNLLRGIADYVVVDVASCVQMSEVALAAECSDTAIYVVKQDFAKAQKVMEGIEDVCSYGVSLSGGILNHAQVGFSGYGYGKYGKYYGKYSYRKYGYGKYGSYGYGYGNKGKGK